MQQRLFVSLRLAIQNLTQDRQTKRWLKTIPDVGKVRMFLLKVLSRNPLLTCFSSRNPSQTRLSAWPGRRTAQGPSVLRVYPTSTRYTTRNPASVALILNNSSSFRRLFPRCVLLPLPSIFSRSEFEQIETLAPLESSPPARPIKEKAAVEKTPPTRFSRKPRSFSETRPSSAPAPASVPTTPTPVPATPVAETPATPALFLPPPEELFSSGSADEVCLFYLKL
jgi:hypothetical protein